MESVLSAFLFRGVGRKTSEAGLAAGIFLDVVPCLGGEGSVARGGVLGREGFFDGFEASFYLGEFGVVDSVDQFVRVILQVDQLGARAVIFDIELVAFVSNDAIAILPNVDDSAIFVIGRGASAHGHDPLARAVFSFAEDHGGD